MVEQEKVFVLIGAAGSDQITACARYADSMNVPYLSAGVNEDGLTGLQPTSPSRRPTHQQSPGARLAHDNKMKKTKVAIVLNDTPALNETQQSITKLAAGGRAANRAPEPDREERLRRRAAVGGQRSCATPGAEVVYVLTSPVHFIKLATNGQAQAYSPVWVGPGTTNGFNIVAQAGCPAIGAAKFLSPFPQLDAIDDLDPDYQPAYQKYVGGKRDDIGMADWGLNKVIAPDARGDRARTCPARASSGALTSGKEFHSNVYPDVSYNGSDPVRGQVGPPAGGRLRRAGSWKTIGRFTPLLTSSCPTSSAAVGADRYGHRRRGAALMVASGRSRHSSSAWSPVPATGWSPSASCSSTSRAACSTSPRASSARSPSSRSVGRPRRSACRYCLAMLLGLVGRPGHGAGHRTVRGPAAVRRPPGHAAGGHGRGVAAWPSALELWLGEARLRFLPPALGRLDRVSVFGFAGVRPAPPGPRRPGGAGRAARRLFFSRTNLGLAILGLSQEPAGHRADGHQRPSGCPASPGALAGLLGRLGGILSAPLAGGFGPGFLTLSALIPAFTAAVLGGMTSLPGAFVGGVVVGVAESLAVSLPGHFVRAHPRRPSVMVFALLVAVLAVRPRGLLGKRPERRRRRSSRPRREARGRPIGCERPAFRPHPAAGWPGASCWPRSPRSCSSCPATRSDVEVNIYTEAVIYAIIGLSLNVLLGYAGQISLGPPGVRRHRRLHLGLHGHRPRQHFVAAIGVADGRRRAAGAAARRSCRCGSPACTSPS